jgi:hypothetical protein
MAKRSTTTTTPRVPKLHPFYIAEVMPATDDQPASEKAVALIKAHRDAGAMKHFIAPRFVIRVATSDDIYACAEAKIKPEVAASGDAE